MRRNKEFTIGIAVAVLFVILVWLVLMFGKQSFPTLGEKYSLIAKFDTIPGVDKNTPVNMNGIQIGRVESITLVDEEGKRYAKVKLLIRKDRKVYASDECRLSPPLLSFGGNISLEIAPRRNYTGPLGYALKDGAEIPGVLQSDLSQSFVNLEGDLTTALQGISGTTKKIESFIDSINAAIGTPQEAKEKQRRFQEIIDKSGELMDELNRLAVNVNDLLGDEEFHGNIQSVASQLPDTLLDIRNSLDNFNTFSQESRITLNRLSQTFDKAETNLDQLQGFTAALGEDGADILKAVARTSRRLDGVFNDISTLMNALQNPDGSLGQLINNPELYNNIQQTIANVEEISETLKPIVGDFRVFSDKIARDPGVLGVRGVISPASPLKGLPVGRTVDYAGSLHKGALHNGALHNGALPRDGFSGKIIPASHNGLSGGFSSCLSFDSTDPELEMIQRQHLVQRAISNASARQQSSHRTQFSSPACTADGCGTGGEMMDGNIIYEGMGGFDSGFQSDASWQPDGRQSDGLTPSAAAPPIGSQSITPPQPMVSPVPLLTAPRPTDQLLLPTTILEFEPEGDAADPSGGEARAIIYPTEDRGYVLELETELPQPAPPEIQFAQMEENSAQQSTAKEEETDMSAYAPQKITSVPSPVQPQKTPIKSQIKPQAPAEPSKTEPQYGSVRRGINR